MYLIEKNLKRVRRRVLPTIKTLTGVAYSVKNVVGSRPVVVHVSDGAGWVLDEVGRNVASRIQDQFDMRVVSSFSGVRHCLIHFAAPPICLKNKAYKVVHPSNSLVLTWTHGLPDYDDPNIQAELENLDEGIEYLRKILVATTTGKTFLEGMGVLSEKIVHIPFGVDTDLFRPPSREEKDEARRTLGIPDNAVCIGSFQKDSPGWTNDNVEPKLIKGPDVLVEVLKIVAESFPVYVLLTGPARGYVIKYLEQNDIPYRHDNLSSPECLPLYYHALDLYLITARDEGGPVAFLESIASGVPVVSTNMGIPRDAIIPGENGMIAEVGDVDEISQAVIQLLGDTALMEQISTGARETALKYDWDIIARRYAEALYQPLIKDR